MKGSVESKFAFIGQRSVKVQSILTHNSLVKKRVSSMFYAFCTDQKEVEADKEMLKNCKECKNMYLQLHVPGNRRNYVSQSSV